MNLNFVEADEAFPMTGNDLAAAKAAFGAINHDMGMSSQGLDQAISELDIGGVTVDMESPGMSSDMEMTHH